MKRALSIAAVTAMSLLVFLFVGYAQEEGATSVAELLDQELASMEAIFGNLEAFMAELIREIKGNMGDIDDFNVKVDDLRDIVTAVAIEIKTAEGRIIGLREDVNALGDTQQELRIRIVALEAGLSELSTFVGELSARLAVTNADLGILRQEFDALIADYDVFKEAFAAFQVSVYSDIDALRDSVYTDFDLFKTDVYADIGALRDGIYVDLDLFRSDLDLFKTDVYADIGALRDSVYTDFDLFKTDVTADIDALRDSVYTDFGLFKTDVYADIGALRDGVYIDLDLFRSDVYGEFSALRDGFSADISLLSMAVDDFSIRIQALEDEDVGTFKKKVIDLERSMAAVAIRIDNNRAKLGGFDHAIANLSEEMAATRESVIAANREVLAEYDARLMALESVDMQSQIDTLYFISIVALLAGMGALIWGFLGN